MVEESDYIDERHRVNEILSVEWHAKISGKRKRWRWTLSHLLFEKFYLIQYKYAQPCDNLNHIDK